MSLEYYLGNFGSELHSSLQEQKLRSIILSENDEYIVMHELSSFVLSQESLSSVMVWMTIKALMPAYGSEYLGLAGDDFDAKLHLLIQFAEKFPEVALFKCHTAECALLAAESIEFIWPLLIDGMLADKKNIYYPTSEMFEFIQQRYSSFEFDMLLLDKYYQPCDIATFDDWLAEFKIQYKSIEQQFFLKNLQWKGM